MSKYKNQKSKDIQHRLTFNDFTIQELKDYHAVLKIGAAQLDEFIKTTTDYHYLQYGRQVTMKHKSVILSIAAHRTYKLIIHKIQSI